MSSINVIEEETPIKDNENKIIETEEVKEEKKQENQEKQEETINENFEAEKERLSALSFSSYDSIDNIKLDKMGQYTCNKCSEIPKIISTDVKDKSILFKCREHGLNKEPLKDFMLNCLNYTTKNWKCSQCDKIQRDDKENFLYCQCTEVFCSSCYKIHRETIKHFITIESDKYNLRCRVSPDHFEEKFIGYCYDCSMHYCKKCEQSEKHDLHCVTPIDTMVIDEKEIDKIRKINKEYRSLISYYESLIRLNNLIIYSYQNYRSNYYNCFNINSIINNYKRNDYIKSKHDIESKVIVPGDKNVNLTNYMKDLFNQEIEDEKTDTLDIESKYCNSFDFQVLTQIPIKNLHVLNLENNCISNIDCITNADFPELVVLNLNNNAIVDISHFEGTKFQNEIQALLLRNNSIKDISVFGKSKMDYLREIDLRNNKIDDINAFAEHKLEFLQCLYLSYNDFDPKDKKFDKAVERMKKELMEYELEPEKTESRVDDNPNQIKVEDEEKEKESPNQIKEDDSEKQDTNEIKEESAIEES